MFRLSRLSDYAVVVLSQLVKEQGQLLTATQLAANTGIPEPTVAKVLKLLSKQDVITSARGMNGGYKMDKAATTITVADVIVALEGPIALTACIEEGAEEKDNNSCCALSSLCPMTGRWRMVNNAIVGALQSLTLADLLNWKHANGS